MSRGRKPNETTELAEIDAGINAVEDPYQLAEFANSSIEELLDYVRRGAVYSVVAMAGVGRGLMALKQRIDHGEWLPFLDKNHLSRFYVRTCMKVVEVFALHPQVIHLPPGRATARLLNSPISRIDAVLADLPEQAVRNLSPWELETRFLEIKLKEKGNTNRKERPMVEPPSEIEKLCTQAASYLAQIAHYKVPRAEYETARRLAHELDAIWRRASYNLFDPGHKTTPPWEQDPMADDLSEDNEG